MILWFLVCVYTDSEDARTFRNLCLGRILRAIDMLAPWHKKQESWIRTFV